MDPQKFLNQAGVQALIGSPYLGGQLDWLGEGELGWRRRWDGDTLAALFLCALSLGLRVSLLACLLLLLGLLICCCSCLSLLIGLGSCTGSVGRMGCIGLLHSGSQELRLSLLQKQLLLCWQQGCQLAQRKGKIEK